MKTLLVFVFLTIASFNLLFAQWTVKDSAQNLLWEGVFFTDNNSGYVAGYGATAYAWLVKTTNAGNNWSHLITHPYDTVAEFMFRSVFFTDINTGYVAGGSSSTLTANGMVLKTTNGGNSWVSLTLPIHNLFDYVYFINSNTGYVSGYGTIIKTTDAGANWILQNPNYPLYLFQMCFTDINTGYVVGNQGQIRKTTDGGNNWFAQVSGATESLWGIGFADANTGIISGGTSSNMIPVILRTTNGGINWYPIPYSSSPIGLLWRVRFTNPSVGYIAGFSGQILKTTDNGVNWCRQNPPFNCNFRDVSFTNTSTGYLVGASGSYGIILKTTNGGGTCVPTGIEPDVKEIPTQFRLYQNYPNPFNPSTLIKFNVAKTTLVRLSIYNVLGEEVESLVNEQLNPGTYQINWDASGYPSGVYFYKLKAGNFSSIQKMVLIK